MVQRLSNEAHQRARQLAAQNERLRELDRLKDEFVATASHELRTPHVAQRLSRDVARPCRRPALAAREGHLRIVQRNADRLAILVDQLLFLARADSHPLELDRQPVDLAGILDDAAETAGPAAREKNISLLVAAGPHPRLLADRPQILRVVDNLVANAVKFTPDGGSVRLVARREGGAAMVEVTDTGLGIAPAEQPDLFNRFYRGTNAIEKAIPGSGLGLAISQVIAEAHGGTIQLESTPGAGSTFRLMVPLAR